MTFLPVIPTKFYILSHIFSDSLPDIYIFWHSLWYVFWNSISHCVCRFIWHIVWHSIWHSMPFDLTCILTLYLWQWAPLTLIFFRNLQTFTQVPEKNTCQLLLIRKCRPGLLLCNWLDCSHHCVFFQRFSRLKRRRKALSVSWNGVRGNPKDWRVKSYKTVINYFSIVLGAIARTSLTNYWFL